MSQANTTTNHDKIRKWVEERQGRPSLIKASGKGGVLRIDFGEAEEEFEEISWDEFFQIFDDSNLAFLHQDETSSGTISQFNKFVSRKEG
jgi:anaerobic selenocysteine-containing dehydrogenase